MRYIEIRAVYIDQAPTEEQGQKAVDESLTIENAEHRVAYVDGTIIMLMHQKDDLGEERYHGFIVTVFKALSKGARDALYKAGYVQDIKTGKMK